MAAVAGDDAELAAVTRFGGAGADLTTLCIAIEELGRPDLPDGIDAELACHLGDVGGAQPPRVEVGAGAGWYTEILAPYVEGDLYAAHFPENSGVEYFDRLRSEYEARLARDPDVFGRVQIVVFDPTTGALELEDNSVDRVLSFRNVHTWLRFDSEKEAFTSFFRVLRPGGYLGIVQHRSRQLINRDQMVETGYVVQDAVIEAAQAAGFEFVAASEVNANFRDTANHPEGVWTLPPSLRLGDRDRERYRSIGESDRMTLKFRKPVSGEALAQAIAGVLEGAGALPLCSRVERRVKADGSDGEEAAGGVACAGTVGDVDGARDR